MGLIGMAFGLGFVLGPLLGGLLLSLPLAEDWRLRLPFLVAAGFSTIAWVLVLTRLPESRPRGEPAREAARVVSWRGIVDTISLPGIGRLVLVGFLAVLAFAAFEGTFALFLQRRMQLGRAHGGVCLRRDRVLERGRAGGLDPPARPPLWRAAADRRRARAGRRADSPAWRWPANAPELAGSMVLLGVGQGLLSPSVSGLLSRITPIERAGGRFRHAHLGADARPDDQLLGLEYPARQGLDRRTVLGCLRRRRCSPWRSRPSPRAGTEPPRTRHSGRSSAIVRGRAELTRPASAGRDRDSRRLPRVGVAVSGHDLDDFVAVGIQDLDGLDQGLGAGVE